MATITWFQIALLITSVFILFYIIRKLFKFDIFKFLRPFLKLTAHSEKFPTDMDLDYQMDYVKDLLHIISPLLRRIIYKKVKLFFQYRWKYLAARLVALSLFVFVAYFAWIKVAQPIFIIKERTEFVTQAHKELLDSPIPKENLLFMTTLSIFESGHNYSVSRGQYWGAFQIGDLGRQELHMENFPKEDFLKDTILQNWAMNTLMKKNYEYLYPYIEKYKIPKRGGVKIGTNIVTVSGLLAGAHLVGPFAAIEFLKTNGATVPKDGNGVPITKYFQFNNIDLELNK